MGSERQEDWHDRMHREVVTCPISNESSKQTLERHSKKLQEWLEKNPAPEEVK